jgi:hypothetical protein
MIIYVYYIYIDKYTHLCNPLHIYISQVHEQFHSAAQAGPLSLKTRVEYSSMPKNAIQAVMGRRGLRKRFGHGRTNFTKRISSNKHINVACWPWQRNQFTSVLIVVITATRGKMCHWTLKGSSNQSTTNIQLDLDELKQQLQQWDYTSLPKTSWEGLVPMMRSFYGLHHSWIYKINPMFSTYNWGYKLTYLQHHYIQWL